MRITVTKSDIKNGKKSCSDGCPVALALKRKTKKRADVFAHGINYYGESGFRQVGLPRDAKEFIMRFDAGRKVKPFSFNLNVK